MVRLGTPVTMTSDNPFGLDLSLAVFDRATRLAMSMFASAGASIILVHQGRIWRSRYAELLPSEDPVTESILRGGELFWVEDGLTDPRFRDHPLVVGPPFLRFTVGVPIRLADASTPGVLSVSGLEPQSFDPKKAARLKDIADFVADEWARAQAVAAQARSLRERDQALEALRQAQKMESIGQLTGGMSHDFNNLLGIIVGNLELLTEGLPHDSKLLAHVKTAIDAAERGASLNRRLLAFARQQTLAPCACDARQLLEQTVALLQRTLGEGNAIRTIAPESPMRCTVDPAQFEAALINLALNARDAMPDGGTLSFETRATRLDREQLSGAVDVLAGDYIEIAVSDTGTGMAPDVLGRCCEPFFTTKEVGKGSGLGLSMVYGFVKQSHGHIKIDSEAGRGTTVRLYLPATTAELEAPVPAAMPQEGGGGELILVVEDNARLRAISVETLRRAGYRTVEAEDGATALEALEANPRIRLLFSDVAMPGGINGIELAEQSTRRRPELKVLLTSGFTGQALADQGRLGPGRELLDKPFRAAVLLRRIGLLLGKDGEPSA